MGIIRNKIQTSLKENDKLMEGQSAYTENRKAADNIFVLNYCIQKSQEFKKPVILKSIDFKKSLHIISKEMSI